MSDTLAHHIDQFLTRYLVRYFRTAVSVSVDQVDNDVSQDRYLLRLHWAISGPINRLVTHLREHPQQIQTVLESRIVEDDAHVRGRLDARATAIKQIITGHPGVLVSYEPLRTYQSGPNYLLIWVLEQAWRLAKQFTDMVPIGATYGETASQTALELEAARRFDSVQQAVKQMNLTRRPAWNAVKEADRSRRQVYVLACEAYRSLQAIEEGDTNAIAELLKETLLGPLHRWQRFELLVGIGMANALSVALGETACLGFFMGGKPIVRVGDYEVYWQTRTDIWREPEPQPSEVVATRILKQYGLTEGRDRPDLVVFNRRLNDVVAIAEVKYFRRGDEEQSRALRAAVIQTVRYVRGYRDLNSLDDLLDHSVIALIRADCRQKNESKRYGVPILVDFDGLIKGDLENWAKSLVKSVRSKKSTHSGKLIVASSESFSGKSERVG